MVCRLVGCCLFICIITQSAGQTDLVGRCETCHEVVKNFQKACSVILLCLTNIDCTKMTLVLVGVQFDV